MRSDDHLGTIKELDVALKLGELAMVKDLEHLVAIGEEIAQRSQQRLLVQHVASGIRVRAGDAARHVDDAIAIGDRDLPHARELLHALPEVRMDRRRGARKVELVSDVRAADVLVLELARLDAKRAQQTRDDTVSRVLHQERHVRIAGHEIPRLCQLRERAIEKVLEAEAVRHHEVDHLLEARRIGRRWSLEELILGEPAAIQRSAKVACERDQPTTNQ